MIYGMEPLKYYLSLFAVNTISNLTLFLFFSFTLTPKQSHKKSVAVLFIILSITTALFLPHRDELIIKAVVYYPLITVLLLLLYKNTVLECIISFILCTAAQLLGELLFSIYSVSIGVSPVSAASDFKMILLIATPATVFFEGVFALLWRKIFKRNDTLRFNMMIFMILAPHILLFSALAIMIFVINIYYIPVIITLVSVCLLSLISVTVVIINLKRTEQIDRDAQLYRACIENYKQRENLFNYRYMEIRRIKHDLKKHFNTLNNLKDDKMALHEYISSLDTLISTKIDTDSQ